MARPYDVILWNPPDHGGGFGFCDRLRGLAGVSVLSAGFQLPVVMPWPISAQCPFRLSSVLRLPHVHCLAAQDDPMPPGARVALELEHAINATPKAMYRYYASRFDLPLFSDEAEFVTLCAELLRRFEPVVSIRHRVESFVRRRFRQRMIGIHIRRTDKFRGDTALAREHDDSIVEHLAETLPGCRDCGVFIASDDVTSRQYVGERIQAHGLYVASMAHDFHTDQIRQTGGEELMLDILLLAACERITATVSSGVVDYASLVGNTPVDWVGPDDAADPWFWGGADKRKRETPGFRH